MGGRHKPRNTARYFYLKEFNIAYGGTAVGTFESSQPIAFYLMTPTQFNAFNSTGIPSDDLYYLAPNEKGNITQAISAPGTYYAVFYPEYNTSVTVQVSSAIHVAYNLPASAYLYTARALTAQFSLAIQPGKYYLVWWNPYSDVADVTVSQSIEVS